MKRKIFLSIFVASLFILGGYLYVNDEPIGAAWPLGTELILYHFEEASGTLDNAGTGGATYDASYSGGAGATTTSLFANRAAEFGETNDYVDTGYGNGINPSTQSVTISMWVYKNEASAGCNSGDDDHFFGATGPSANTRMYIRCRVGNWAYRLGGNSAVDSGVAMTHRTWTHVALVLNASNDTSYFYIDGQEATTAAIPSYTIGRDFTIGHVNDGSLTAEGSNMTIDEVAIYDSALTGKQVNQIYAEGAPPGAITGSLTATPYEEKVFLEWGPTSATSTDYYIEYKLNADSEWSNFADGVSTVASTTVTGLTNGSLYNFRVTPLNEVATGTVSSEVSETPAYQLAFVTGTQADQSTTTGNSIALVASSTSANSTTTWTLSLENPAGEVQVAHSTSTRYGDYRLNHFNEVIGDVDLSIDANTSGIAYVQTTGTLFTVHNNENVINEISTTTGTSIRSITCTSCGDIEGIDLVSSSPDGSGGWNHLFIISTESYTANARIFAVEIASSGSVTVDDSTYYQTGITHGSNLGLEGVAYDAENEIYYVNTEKTDIELWQVATGTGVTATSLQICTNLTLTDNASDFSDLEYASSTLFITSHESSLILPIDITSTSSCAYADSDGDGSTNSEDWLNNPSVGGTDQIEGISIDDTGDWLYVVGEADFFAKYRTDVYEVQHTFSGLSDGSYVLKASYVDSNGVTANALEREIGVDSTAPTITSVTSTTTDATYTTDDVIALNIVFSEAVTSTGDITITVETGDTDRTCTTSLSVASTSAGCNYTVQAGDTSSDLTVSSISGTITDTGGNSMSSYTIGTNLAASSAIVVDTTAPTISSVTSSTSDGTYGVGDEITIDVTFSEAVTTSGTVTVTLETGDTDRTCNITASSASTASCTYTVQENDESSDLEAKSVSGTITDGASIAMTSFTIASNFNGKAIVIDTSPPAAAESSGGNGSPAVLFGGNFGLITETVPPPDPVTPPGVVVPPSAQPVPGGDGGSAVGVSPAANAVINVILPSPLVPGDEVPQVRILQKILNQIGFSVATEGPGSPGNETNFFGRLTRIAVIKFQLENDIRPNGELNSETKSALANELLSKVRPAAIQTPNSSPTTPSVTPPTTPAQGAFNRNLETGDIHPDVRELQQWLNQNGFLLTDSGPGSPGNETSKFGALTRRAVILLQNTFKDEILTPVGLSRGTGFFGPSTRNFINNR